MYKNQLQELAQRSCFNLPSYACIREGPDHAPRFKASVNFNGEIFDSPSYCTTLRQAEHAAAEVALNVLSTRGPARSLTARVLDETGIYKNLLQETAHRAGLNLPVYTTVRSGPAHVPIFTSTVELAGMNFTGEPAKTKKQAEKNAAIAAWSALKKMPNLVSFGNKEVDTGEELDQAVVARVLSTFRTKDECKHVRWRDQNQVKRRIVRAHRDTCCGTSSSTSSNNTQQHKPWRLLDLFMDSVPEGFVKKQNCFVSLLPPPPPRTASKILPPNSSTDSPSPYPSNRPIPVRIRCRSQIITPVEEHQRDEEEWLGGKSNIKKPTENEGPCNSNSSVVYGSSSISRQSPLSNTGKMTASMLDRPFGSLDSSQLARAPIKASTGGHMAGTMYTGGFNPHKIAPAVQIRSVIPVCAAPPPNPMIQPSNPPAVKETSASALSPTTTSILPAQTGEEIPSASSKFNKPHLGSTRLSSEFNKLQL
ncbi:double-stranded RNA-binding protein 3-like isoform X2 [Juglans regia]|nr:double-stranded RNA-binding protein 3-like isoform X2 [Juglans regia]XP_018834904.1 double-stranded RNA-binding protein 3-like isoform X2 [Juglans regia]